MEWTTNTSSSCATAIAVAVEYIGLDDGARLVYTTSDDTLVDGLHAWFDRQTMDHS